VDLIASLDDVEKRKFLTIPDSNFDPSVAQSVANLPFLLVSDIKLN
jgi:hypothetical protein